VKSNFLAESALAGPLSDAHLEVFEGQLGVQLPSEYRDFLRKTNGGVPTQRGLTFFNEIDEEHVQTEFEGFYSLNDKAWPDKYKWRLHESLDQIYETVIMHNKPDALVVPIGRDVAGNLVVISIGGDKLGQIGFYHHDYDEIYFLSASFDAFCDSLTDLPAEE
jgi:hypothetical protein